MLSPLKFARCDESEPNIFLTLIIMSQKMLIFFYLAKILINTS